MLRVLALLVLGLLASPARADVLVVDIAGQGDFTSLQPAIDAASDGDILLIRPGNYHNLFTLATIHGKGLVLIGDGATRPILPPISVSNSPAGSTTVLRYLDVRGNAAAFFIGSAAVSVVDSSGTVLVEDSLISGNNASPSFTAPVNPTAPGHVGLLVWNSPAVAAVRCTFQGGAGAPAVPHPLTGIPTPPSSGAPGVRVNASRLALAASTVTAGDSGSIAAERGPAGAPGLDSLDSEVHATGCSFLGGAGGLGLLADGPSGAGLLQDGSSSALRELDNTFVGGAGALDLELLAGAHSAWPGQSVELLLSSPVRSGQTGALTVSGPPGTLFALFWSFSAGFQPVAGFHGVFVPGVPFNGPLLTAVLPGSGELALDFVAPELGGVVEGFLNVDQILTSQPGAGLVLGSPGSYVQVDSAF